MMRSTVTAAMLAALATAAAVGAKGWPRPTAGTICGAGGCRSFGARDARRFDPSATYRVRIRPPAPASFYLVVLRTPGAPARRLYYFPASAAIREDRPWAPAWRRLNVRLGLEPYPKPRLARVRVDGRPARSPASYLALYALRGRRVGGDPVAPLIEAGELRTLWRDWISIEPESARPSPWTDPQATLWLARRDDLLVRNGQTLRIPHRLAERIRARRSLARR
jgi:hypothetical protein